MGWRGVQLIADDPTMRSYTPKTQKQLKAQKRHADRRTVWFFQMCYLLFVLVILVWTRSAVTENSDRCAGLLYATLHNLRFLISPEWASSSAVWHNSRTGGSGDSRGAVARVGDSRIMQTWKDLAGNRSDDWYPSPPAPPTTQASKQDQ